MVDKVMGDLGDKGAKGPLGWSSDASQLQILKCRIYNFFWGLRVKWRWRKSKKYWRNHGIEDTD